LGQVERRLQQGSLGIFCLFLALPALVYLVGGPADGFVFGQPQPAWPTTAAVLSTDPEGRDQLAQALLDRSTLRREAISLRNRSTWEWLGYIDTRKVVSGAPGWLFYKKSLTAWDCSEHDALDQGLHRLRLLIDLADANDLSFAIASAPNKATILPEKRIGRVEAYSRCFELYEARLRAALQARPSPRLVDHADVLVPISDENDVFVRTDTHWTRKSAYRAMAQLASRLPGTRAAEQAPEIEFTAKNTDLGNQMLLLPEREMVAGVRLSADSAQLSSGDSPRIGIFHDSFYQLAPDYLRALIPNVTPLNMNFPDVRDKSLDEFDLLVIASAERALLTRMDSRHHFGWHSNVGDWLLNRMSDAAERCDWSRAQDLLPEIETKGLKLDGTGKLVSKGKDPQLLARLPKAEPGHSFCLELRMGTKLPIANKRFARLYLDARDALIDAGDPVSEHLVGRTIEFPYGLDRERVALVLPPSALGRRLRVDFHGLKPNTQLLTLRIAPSGDLPTSSNLIEVGKRRTRVD
jgi:hypothetical protein